MAYEMIIRKAGLRRGQDGTYHHIYAATAA